MLPLALRLLLSSDHLSNTGSSPVIWVKRCITQLIWSDHKPLNHWQYIFRKKAVLPLDLRLVSASDHLSNTGSSPVIWVKRCITQLIWSDHKPLDHWQYIFRQKAVLPLDLRLVLFSDHLSNTGSGPVIYVYSKRQYELHYSTDLEWSQAFKPLAVHLSKESCAAIGLQACVAFRSLE